MSAGQYLNIIKKLAKKYDRTFNFFQVKPINEIIYDQNLKLVCIQFKDIASLLDENQYLKRFYFLLNKAKRNQISERIQILAEFYHNNLLLKYEYPTMIVTNTKNIFQKKLRRMKKMVANDNSSEDSSEENSGLESSFKSTTFLKSIGNEKPASQTQQKDIPLSLNLFINIGFEEQIHNIYQSSKEFMIEQSYENRQNKNLKSIEISHLICDFDDVDNQLIFAMYKKANKKVQQQKNRQKFKKNIELNQTNIEKNNYEDNKYKDKKIIPSNSSIVITALDYEGLKGNKNITSLYQKKYSDKIERYQIKTHQAIHSMQIKNNQLYLPFSKNNQKPNFQKSKQSSKGKFFQNSKKGQNNHKDYYSGQKQIHKYFSPQPDYPKVGYPVSKAYQSKKQFNHDYRNIEIIKQKAMSVLQKVKSSDRLKTFRSYEKNKNGYQK